MATTTHACSVDVSTTNDLRLDAPEICPLLAFITPTEEAERFELFRRAVCERDEAAWEELSRLYHRLLIAWAQRHPAASHSSEDADVWARRAFARFFAAVSPTSFGSFPGLAAVLRYLKLCVHSEIVDDVRRRHTAHTETLAEDHDDVHVAPDAAAYVESGLAAHALWRAIIGEIQDETERLVAVATLVRQRTPREVAARHPDRFATVADVYRVKRNLFDRLRRNPSIRRFLET